MYIEKMYLGLILFLIPLPFIKKKGGRVDDGKLSSKRDRNMQKTLEERSTRDLIIAVNLYMDGAQILLR